MKNYDSKNEDTNNKKTQTHRSPEYFDFPLERAGVSF